MEGSAAESNVSYDGPAQEGSENMSKCPRTVLEKRWQRMWLFSALVQRIDLRLNKSFGFMTLAEEISRQAGIDSDVSLLRVTLSPSIIKKNKLSKEKI